MIGGLALAGKGIISFILMTVIFIVSIIIIILNINRIFCGSVGGTGDQLPLFSALSCRWDGSGFSANSSNWVAAR